MLLFTTERNSKVPLVVKIIPSKFWSLPQVFLKVILHVGLNVYRESSWRSRFVANSLLVCTYEWSQTRSLSFTDLISFLTSMKVVLIPIESNMHWLWIEIKEQDLWI